MTTEQLFNEQQLLDIELACDQVRNSGHNLGDLNDNWQVPADMGLDDEEPVRFYTTFTTGQELWYFNHSTRTEVALFENYVDKHGYEQVCTVFTIVF